MAMRSARARPPYRHDPVTDASRLFVCVLCVRVFVFAGAVVRLSVWRRVANVCEAVASKFLSDSNFRLPGEAQKIARLVEAFGHYYVEANAEAAVLANEGTG
jgi:hypothetical protein